MTQLTLAAQRCNACLTTRNRIVTGARAAQIVSDCRASGQHFFCHKGDGHTIHCRGVHDILLRDCGGSVAYRVARGFRIPIVETDPDKA